MDWEEYLRTLLAVRDATARPRSTPRRPAAAPRTVPRSPASIGAAPSEFARPPISMRSADAPRPGWMTSRNRYGGLLSQPIQMGPVENALDIPLDIVGGEFLLGESFRKNRGPMEEFIGGYANTLGLVDAAFGLPALASLPMFAVRAARGAAREARFPAMAALRWPDGTIAVGRTHADAWSVAPRASTQIAPEEGFISGHGLGRIFQMDTHGPGGDTRAFTTDIRSIGPREWMSRRAADRAVAQVTGVAGRGTTTTEEATRGLAGLYTMREEERLARMNDMRAMSGQPRLTRAEFLDTVVRPKNPLIYKDPEHLLAALNRRQDWTILSAENPKLPTSDAVTAVPMEQRTRNLIAALRQRGYSPIEARGMYGAPEGSVLVFGLPEDEAMGFARQFGQESIVSPRGLVYQDGRLAPRRGPLTAAPDATDYYTELDVGGQPLRFQADVDFDAPTMRPPEPDAPANPNTQIGTGRFFSRVERAVETAKLTKAPGSQWEAYLSKQPMAREEFETVLRPFLQENAGRSLTRDEVLAAARERAIRLQETTLPRGPEVEQTWTLYDDDGTPVAEFFSAEDAEDALRDFRLGEQNLTAGYVRAEDRPNPFTIERPRYQAYTEPGGKDYREIVMQLPMEGQEARAPINSFTSSHWEDIDNPLLHIRYTERTGPNGERVLFVEEIQSDWHQEGRKSGYRTGRQEPPLDPTTLTLMGGPGNWFLRDAHGRDWFSTASRGRAERRLAEFRDRGVQPARPESGVPDAPLKRTEDWVGLAWRRIMDEATSQGFDRVAWTTGAQQDRRYGRALQNAGIHQLKWDGQRLVAFSRDGDLIREIPNVTDTNLDNYVGAVNGAALRRALSGEGSIRPHAPLEGELAGATALSGMETFYDEMLPRVVRDWAKRRGVNVPVQRHGATPLPVEQVQRLTAERDRLVREMERIPDNPFSLPGATDATAGAEARRYLELRDRVREIDRLLDQTSATRTSSPLDGTSYIDVTPELRESIRTRGQELYNVVPPLVGAGAGAAAGAAAAGGEEGEPAEAGLGIAGGAILGAAAGRGRLRPHELEFLSRGRTRAEVFERVRRALPSAEELAHAAEAGRERRNWYLDYHRAAEESFGADEPRFSALLAALSPQQSVEMNLDQALTLWTRWVDAGRPQDPARLRRLLRSHVGVPSRLPNAVRALAAPSGFEALRLSGPKVHEFRLALGGEPDTFVGDTHMASLFGVDPERVFSGTDLKGNRDAIGRVSVASPGYLAAAERMREATAQLGGDWTPTQAQAATWSWAQPQVIAGTPGNLREPIRRAGLTPEGMRRNPFIIQPFVERAPTFHGLMAERGPALERAGFVPPTTQPTPELPADPRNLDLTALRNLIERIAGATRGSYINF